MSGMVNDYKVFVKKEEGMCVIHFTGKIGTYWREGEIEFGINGLDKEQIEQKVLYEVEMNKNL